MLCGVCGLCAYRAPIKVGWEPSRPDAADDRRTYGAPRGTGQETHTTIFNTELFETENTRARTHASYDARTVYLPRLFTVA